MVVVVSLSSLLLLVDDDAYSRYAIVCRLWRYEDMKQPGVCIQGCWMTNAAAQVDIKNIWARTIIILLKYTYFSIATAVTPIELTKDCWQRLVTMVGRVAEGEIWVLSQSWEFMRISWEFMRIVERIVWELMRIYENWWEFMRIVWEWVRIGEN